MDRALATAFAAREREPATEMPGVFRFDVGKATYYASEVRLALGGRENYQRAAVDAQEALDIFGAAPEDQRCPEFVAAAQLDLCAAHLALDDLEAADEHLRPVLRVPAESRTLPIIQRITKTHALIGSPKFSNNVLASDLREQVVLFCAYPASRELPREPHGH